MGKLGEIWRRLKMLARRDAAARELDEEMRLHREMKERELIAGGEREAEARYAAARAFGNGMSLSERGRQAWGWRWLEDLAQDGLFAMRGLRRSPGYAATAVLTLILGIGATTAIFSVVNTVLLWPLPYGDPARLVRIEENHDGATNFSFANYLDLRAAPLRSVQQPEAYRPWTFNVSGGAEPAQTEGAMISAGMARVYTWPDNRSCAAELLARERDARAAKRGIWALPFYRVRTPAELGDDEIDKFEIVEGQVTSAAEVRGRVFLNFGRDFRTDFTVTIAPDDMKSFRAISLDPRTLTNKNIRVRGWVALLNGPEIGVTHPEQLEILP